MWWESNGGEPQSGGGASATGNGVACGTASHADGNEATAFGAFASALGINATALGTRSGPRGAVSGATNIGNLSGFEGAGIYSTALGAGKFSPQAPHALGDFSIAIGGGDDSNPFGKVLIGARSNRFLSIALGNASVADSDFAMALGFNAKAGSGLGPIGPVAIGADARATADSSTALGRFANASAPSALAVGRGAVASRPRAVALGSGSLANVADTVSVGTNTARRRIVNVAPGIANSDVPTLGQVKNIATAAAETVMLSAGDNAEIRRELADLKATLRRQEAWVQKQQELLAQQQQELESLKGQKSAAMAE